jgi:hypothetical protein
MQTLRKAWSAAALGLLLLAGALRADGGNVAVLVKAEGPLADAELSAADIKAIYLGDKAFVGKVKVAPIFCTKDEVAAAFLAKVLGISDSQYKKAWADKALQGSGKAPAELGEPEEAVSALRKNGSGLAFVPAEFLLDKKNTIGTKVVLLTK